MRFPKPPKREAKAPKRIARHVPVAKRSAKRGLVEKADAEWSRQVRGFAAGMCERCFIRRPLDAHHIRSKKAHPELRHDIFNGVALCRGCHQWAHAHRADFDTWCVAVFGGLVR